jgi:hypothetical protein
MVQHNLCFSNFKLIQIGYPRRFYIEQWRHVLDLRRSYQLQGFHRLMSGTQEDLGTSTPRFSLSSLVPDPAFITDVS